MGRILATRVESWVRAGRGTGMSKVGQFLHMWSAPYARESRLCCRLHSSWNRPRTNGETCLTQFCVVKQAAKE